MIRRSQLRASRIALGTLLALLLLSPTAMPPTGWPVSIATAADASSDIPGIPLPGPIAAGRLGGAVYDVVYRLTVQPGHVIVASLMGTDGTDFDIYLFDATATTVVSSNGLLVKSVGPTSTESLSWPSRMGGVYYIDLNGATDVEGDYRLTVQTVPDPTPPSASITLAAGRTSINQLTIPVSITATEDLSGIADMAFSTDGVTFESWIPFAALTTRTLSPGDGSRAVWVKVRNGVGLESTPAADTVLIDTRPPSVIALDPSPGATIVGLRPTFSATFDEAITPSSWTDLGLVVQSPSGTLVTGTYTYDAARRVGKFLPATDLTPGAVYVVNVGLIRDLAGNGVAPLGSWSIIPLAPTTLRAEATSTVLPVGGTSRLHVTLTGAPSPTTVEMLASTGDGAFQSVSTFDLGSGSLSLLLAPTQNTIYRFRYNGAFGVAPATADVRVLVRRSVVFAGRNPTTVSGAKVGSVVNLVGSIGPRAAGVGISFRLYRFDSARRAWVYAGSHGRKTDSTGRATFSWAPPAAGLFYWRVAVASTPDFANNTSPVYRWLIGR
jgi:hypothetical protein